MDNNLRNLCEQIQEDTLAFADSGDYSGLSSETLDELCEIVVRNFSNFDDSETNVAPRKQSFFITDIEFDVGWNQGWLQKKLQEEWRGQITELVLEDELVDYITDTSGWCVRNIEYSALTPTAEQK